MSEPIAPMPRRRRRNGTATPTTIQAAPWKWRSLRMRRPTASRARPSRRPRPSQRPRTPFHWGFPRDLVRRAAGSKKTLILGLAAAATVVAIAIAVFLPPPEPIAAAEPAAADVIVPPRSSGPAPGLLVVTAAPWGQVRRLSGADGTPVELPVEHTTPLRLWVAPGLHHAEVTLAGARSPPAPSTSAPVALISAPRPRSRKEPFPAEPTTSRRWVGGSRPRLSRRSLLASTLGVATVAATLVNARPAAAQYLNAYKAGLDAIEARIGARRAR